MKMLLITTSFVILFHYGYCQSNNTFKIDWEKNVFLKDGKPFRFIAAEIHYFRIHESSWRDRLSKIKAAGFNALQTIIEWNSHETYQGKYDFKGKNRFTKFLI